MLGGGGAGVHVGPLLDLVDVGLRVVVGVEGLVDVVRGAVCFQVIGGGDDCVGGIPAVCCAVVVAVEPVGGPGAGEELHRPSGACLVDGAFSRAGGVSVAAVVTFDLADPGQDLPGDVEGEPRLLVEQ